jgi:hypothetical protein
MTSLPRVGSDAKANHELETPDEICQIKGEAAQESQDESRTSLGHFSTQLQ